MWCNFLVSAQICRLGHDHMSQRGSESVGSIRMMIFHFKSRILFIFVYIFFVVSDKVLKILHLCLNLSKHANKSHTPVTPSARTVSMEMETDVKTVEEFEEVLRTNRLVICYAWAEW